MTENIFKANSEAAPQAIGEILPQITQRTDYVQAVDLIDQTIIIKELVKLPSRMGDQDHIWGVIGETAEKGRVFSTLLGGVAVVASLDAIVDFGFDDPIMATLTFVKKGAYGGYYLLS